MEQQHQLPSGASPHSEQDLPHITTMPSYPAFIGQFNQGISNLMNDCFKSMVDERLKLKDDEINKLKAQLKENEAEMNKLKNELDHVKLRATILEMENETLKKKESMSNDQKQQQRPPSMLEQLKSINREIWLSFPQNGPYNYDRAIKALHKLACLNPQPTAQELLECKDLLINIAKMKNYKGSEMIKNKAIHLCDKFNIMIEMASLCEEDVLFKKRRID